MENSQVENFLETVITVPIENTCKENLLKSKLVRICHVLNLQILQILTRDTD